MWKHFITETDDRRWTEGKRKAEKDALVGISFLTTIQVVSRPADCLWSYQKQSEVYTANIFQAPSILSETESSIERSLGQFSGDMANLDSAVKALSSVAVDQAGKYKNSIKKDYQVFLRLVLSVHEVTMLLILVNSIIICYRADMNRFYQ